LEQSWEPPGRDDSLPTPGQSAVHQQDALSAARAGHIRVGFVWDGAAPADDEGDHELVSSQHVGHALSWLVRFASTSGMPASTKKSGPELT
jgi:hypothetical protein